jgi:ubiquinone/menaquinone biosynthesis C-methylase UbiE
LGGGFYQMKKLDQEKVKIFYNSVSDVWGNHDPWHEYSLNIIKAYITNKTFFKNTFVLNAGSAGNTYNIDCGLMYHVDIADEKIKETENAYVANIESMPFADSFFDNILCVGSVLNYCDALNAISELARVLKPEGNLVLEFESSWGFEYLGKDDYKRDACIIATEYIEKQHAQWLYAPTYIFKILKSYGFEIVQKYPFHIADGLLSKFMNDQQAVFWTWMDKVLKHISFFRNHGNNIILHCVKRHRL